MMTKGLGSIAIDPLEDTARHMQQWQAMILTLCSIAIDPLEDTAREACRESYEEAKRVPLPSIRWRILQDVGD